MPIYEYRCDRCEKITDVLHPWPPPSTAGCSHCPGVATRIFSTTNFHLLGDGWAKDGYSKKPPSKGKKK